MRRLVLGLLCATILATGGACRRSSPGDAPLPPPSGGTATAGTSGGAAATDPARDVAPHRWVEEFFAPGWFTAMADVPADAEEGVTSDGGVGAGYLEDEENPRFGGPGGGGGEGGGAAPTGGGSPPPRPTAPAPTPVVVTDPVALDGMTRNSDVRTSGPLTGLRRSGRMDDASRESKSKSESGSPAFGTSPHRSAQAPNSSRLMVGDKESLPLESFQAAVRIDGHRARVALDLCYRNTHEQQLEGMFRLRLPDDAAIHHLSFGDVVQDAPLLLPPPGGAMLDLAPAALLRARESGTTQRTARLVPREKAQEAYAAETARAVDPALMEWAGAGVFSTRVFPLLPGRVHRITVVYDLDVAEHEGVRLLDVGVPRDAAKTRVTLQVRGGGEQQLVGSGLAPRFERRSGADGETLVTTVDDWRGLLTVRVAGAETLPLVGDDPAIGPHFAVNVAPELPAADVAANPRAVFLFDMSMSSNPDRAAIWLDLLRETLNRNRDTLREFAVLFFNVETWWWREGFATNDAVTVDALVRDARTLLAEGATDVGAALAEARLPTWSRGPSGADLFLLSDGASSWGAARAGDVATTLERPVYCYTTGLPGTDNRALRTLARTTGGAVFSVTGAADVAAAAVAHRTAPWVLRDVSVAGCDDVLVSGRPTSVYPGQTLRIAGRGRPRGGDVVTLLLEQGATQRTVELPLGAPLVSPLAPRAYGAVAVAHLEELSEAAADEARAYALHYRVTGETCSLLMLESEEAYKRYGIVPTDDADVVRRRPVSAVVSEQDASSDRARRGAREAFLAWLDRLDRVMKDRFDGLHVVREAARSLPESAFTVDARPLLCTLRRRGDATGSYLEQVDLAEPVYDEALARVRAPARTRARGRRAARAFVARRGRPGVDRPAAGPRLHSHAPRRAARGVRPPAPRGHGAPARARDVPRARRVPRSHGQARARRPLLRARAAGQVGRAVRRVQARHGDGLPRAAAAARTRRSAVRVDGRRRRRAGEHRKGLRVRRRRPRRRDDVEHRPHRRRPARDRPQGRDVLLLAPRTKIGGAITTDVTGGYGPEMFVLGKAVPGEYVVKAHYYGSDNLRKTLRSRVFVTVIRDFGRPDEVVDRHAFVLEKTGEAAEVMRLTWGSSADSVLRGRSSTALVGAIQ